MKNGYEKTYEVVVPRLKGCDFPDAARRLGFDLIAKNTLSINFLGRTFEITQAGVRPLDGRDVSVNILSVLVYYTISKGDCEPLNDFCLLHYFSQGLFSNNGTGAEWMTAPLRRKFGDDYQKFCAAATALGLVYEGSRVRGEYTWAYHLLPKMPIKVIYYEADDEFPGDVKILYDKTALNFLDFEPLAVLNGCFISTLASSTSMY